MIFSNTFPRYGIFALSQTSNTIYVSQTAITVAQFYCLMSICTSYFVKRQKLRHHALKNGSFTTFCGLFFSGMRNLLIPNHSSESASVKGKESTQAAWQNSDELKLFSYADAVKHRFYCLVMPKLWLSSQLVVPAKYLGL